MAVDISKKADVSENDYEKNKSDLRSRQLSGNVYRSARSRQSVKAYSEKKKAAESATLQPIRFNADSAFRENPYYYTIAKKFRLAKYLALFAAILFVLVMLGLFPKEISAENFQYLLRDLDINGITVRGDYQSLVYTGGADSRFAVYRGEVAVVNSGTTSLYNGAGIATFTAESGYYHPTLLSGDRYMLVYDRGDTSHSYSVYNAFNEVKRGSFDHPILTAALSDAGAYLIVTSDNQYRSHYYWYDGSFHQILSGGLDAYLISAAISPNGQQALLASVIDNDASYLTRLFVISQKSGDTVCTLDIHNAIPMDAVYLDNGNIGVLFTDRYIVLSPSLVEIETIDFADGNDSSASCGGRYMCYVHNLGTVGNDKEAVFVDDDGSIVFTCREQGELRCVRSCGEYVYLLFEDHVAEIHPKSGTVRQASVLSNGMDVLSIDGGKVLICYAGNAIPVSFT